MKNKINIGDLIMIYKGKPRQQLCYVTNKFGKNKDVVTLCPVGKEPKTIEESIWLVEDILDCKVNN